MFPPPSCIPPAGLEVLTRRHVNDALSELHPRSGLQVLKGDASCPGQIIGFVSNYPPRENASSAD
jgi:hypothetical protein